MSAINKFEGLVNHIYGVYLDATTGFRKLSEQFIEQRDHSLNMYKKTFSEQASIDHLDSLDMIYGKGDPNKPDSVVLHRCTQKEYEGRNAKNGINHKFMGNMALVSLYQYWEDHHRAKVAEQFGLQKNELLAPIMGDIRRIRISIVHHVGIALKDVERCEVLSWYKEGDSIFIDNSKFEEIIFHVKNLINEWNKKLA